MHIPVHKSKDLLSSIGQQQGVILVCLAEVVVVVIRQEFFRIEEVLTDGIQSDIVHSCRMITHHFKDLEVLVRIVNMYLCCEQHLLRLNYFYI